MTYWAKTMNDQKDRYGSSWQRETLRIWYDDERRCWGVTDPTDKNFGTALFSWWDSGQFFDGERWRPITERNAWLDQERIRRAR